MCHLAKDFFILLHVKARRLHPGRARIPYPCKSCCLVFFFPWDSVPVAIWHFFRFCYYTFTCIPTCSSYLCSLRPWSFLHNTRATGYLWDRNWECYKVCSFSWRGKCNPVSLALQLFHTLGSCFPLLSSGIGGHHGHGINSPKPCPGLLMILAQYFVLQSQ